MDEEAENFKSICPECDGGLEIPEDVISGEIVSCPDCGMDYEVKVTDKGEIELRFAEIEGEDWGE
jgi:alpha-aminoadipate carrier protein LysW